MPDTVNSYWDLIEPYWHVFDIYNGPQDFETSIRSAPRPVVLLYAAYFCQSEVHNGGFLQFFWNNTGILAPEAIEGYGVIEMPTLASLLKEAALKLGLPYPRDRDERWDAMLNASGHNSHELKRMFKKQENLYMAFAKATESLHFDYLEKQFWRAAKAENGGFDHAANRYAQNPSLFH
jgi:hypothetical protein